MDTFFRTNFIQSNEFGDKVKFMSLKIALENFYETATVFGDNFFSYLLKTPNGIFLTKVRGDDFVLKYTASIIAAHLFLEHSVFEILEKIDPSLARCEFKTENELLSLLTNNLPNIKLRNNRIAISKAVERLKNLIIHDTSLPDNFRVPKEYHFIINHVDTVNLIAELRNEVTHSGERILDRYAYEVLFINEFLPLVRELLKHDSPSTFLERNLACNFNIINELIKKPLFKDYAIEENFDSLQMNLRRINHFKELGRASFHNTLYMGENPEWDKEDFEKHYNRRIKQKSTIIAQVKTERFNHHKIYNCPCCGSYSLSTFLIMVEIATNRQTVGEAECSLCTYSIDGSLGNPSDFGIMEEPIFGYID